MCYERQLPLSLLPPPPYWRKKESKKMPGINSTNGIDIPC